MPGSGSELKKAARTRIRIDRCRSGLLLTGLPESPGGGRGRGGRVPVLGVGGQGQGQGQRRGQGQGRGEEY